MEHTSAPHELETPTPSHAFSARFGPDALLEAAERFATFRAVRAGRTNGGGLALGGLVSGVGLAYAVTPRRMDPIGRLVAALAGAAALGVVGLLIEKRLAHADADRR